MSHIRIDQSQLLVDVAPREQVLEVCRKFIADMTADRSHFFDLPIKSNWQKEIDQWQPALAKRIPKVGTFLHLGIGGSSLGAEAIVKALGLEAAPQFHFIDNIDPDALTHILRKSDPQTTLVYVITKSGGTFETMACFSIVYDWLLKNLGEAEARNRLVFCTDPQKGDLRQLANQWNIPTFEIPPQLGGRFSALCGVGLFPALVAGIDCQGLLKGAAQYRQQFIDQVEANQIPDVAALSSRLLRHYQNQSRMMTVLMPYSQLLKTFSAWFTQLWAESLGKDGKGLTPVPAVGPTDQHSILQLLKEGPQDKVVGFIEVQGFQNVPSIKWQGPPLKSMDELSGITLNQLMDAELSATRQSLSNSQRPHFSVVLQKLNANSLGQLLFMTELLTGLTGYGLQIDPFDQPGVEEGKKLTRERISACKKSTIL